MFNSKDVAEYYNTTQNHYERWWSLKKNHSLHYGIWDESTKNFREAIINTNTIMMDLAQVKSTDKILDAGCGVGGAAIFLAEKKKAQITGITLSERQVKFANKLSDEKGLDEKVDFQLMDYTKTSFKDGSFDLIWACESVSSCSNKNDFIVEAFRLLKKGGRLIISDFFLSHDDQIDKNNWVQKWADTWAISGFESSRSFNEKLIKNGFNTTEIFDFTAQIQKSAKRMFYAGKLGAIPSETYNFFRPNVSKFARNHYKCGIYQYRALKENLWQYQMILAHKE